MKISVIIPAYNEEKSLGLVLDEIPTRPDMEIVVVDNDSTDKTFEVAKSRGVTVVREERRGYGAACLKGLEAISSDTEIVVILDGDHSDYPEELPRLTLPIERGEADFVLGSRTLGKREDGALGWNQVLGNRLATFWIRIFFGFSYSDMGPFRAISREALDKLEMKDRDYGWNAEMQVKALIHRLRILEVPVSYRKRIGQSKISGTIKGTLLAGTKILGRIFYHKITLEKGATTP